MHRAHLPAQAVAVADRSHLQHLHDQGRLASQHLLDLLEVELLGQQRHRELHVGQRRGRHGLAGHQGGPLDRVALEEVEAVRHRPGDVLVGLHLLGQHQHVEGPAALQEGQDVGAAGGEEVDLDDGGELQDPLAAGHPDEVVEGQPEPGLDQLPAALHGLVVEVDGLQHLDHGAGRGEGHRRRAGQRPALGVAEHHLVADQLVEPDGQGPEDHLGGHLLAGRGRGVALAGPVEELEADHPPVAVGDRLPGDDDLGDDRALRRHATCLRHRRSSPLARPLVAAADSKCAPEQRRNVRFSGQSSMRRTAVIRCTAKDRTSSVRWS